MGAEDHEQGGLLGEGIHHRGQQETRPPPLSPADAAAKAARASELTGCSKWLLIVVAGALAAGASLCISKSKVHGKQEYNPITCTLVSECIKFSGTLLALACGCRVGKGSGSQPVSRAVCIPLFCRDSWPFAVPAALYAIDNNLAFVVLRFISPATMALVWNVKILQTSLLFRFFLGRRLTQLRWLSIGLLFCGVVGSQSHSIKAGHDGTHPHAADASAVQKLLGGGGGLGGGGLGSVSSFAVGIGLVVVCTTISSLAGIYSEFVLKRQANSNFLHQQLHFYSYGILVNGLTLFIKDRPSLSSAGAFFAGYNRWTAASIAFIACMGLATATIFKFLDNVMNVYTQAVAMIITTAVSVACLGFKLTVAFVCGATVCLLAMYIYNAGAGTLLSGGEALYYEQMGVMRAAGGRLSFRIARLDTAQYQTADDCDEADDGVDDCAAGAEVEMSTIRGARHSEDENSGEDESV